MHTRNDELAAPVSRWTLNDDDGGGGGGGGSTLTFPSPSRGRSARRGDRVCVCVCKYVWSFVYVYMYVCVCVRVCTPRMARGNHYRYIARSTHNRYQYNNIIRVRRCRPRRLFSPFFHVRDNIIIIRRLRPAPAAEAAAAWQQRRAPPPPTRSPPPIKNIARILKRTDPAAEAAPVRRLTKNITSFSRFPFVSKNMKN